MIEYRRSLTPHDHQFIPFNSGILPRPGEYVIVTNDITARDASGRMDKLWLTKAVCYTPDICVYGVQESDGLTHWKYAFPRDVIDITNPMRLDITLEGNRDPNCRNESGRASDEDFETNLKFRVGQIYLDQTNTLVLITEQSRDAVKGHDNIWRYNRRGDLGRVTGSAMDFSHERNLVSGLVDIERWREILINESRIHWRFYELDQDTVKKYDQYFVPGSIAYEVLNEQGKWL